MNITHLLRSFAGGIIGPELFGRFDLTKNQTGLAKCLNWLVLPHGPVQNRPGFEYVIEAKDSTKRVRLIPFSFNTEQTFVLELGHNYARWHTGGATLLETGLAVTAITNANPGVVTYVGADPANGDWMFVAGVGGMTQINGRYVKVANVNAGANTFELTDIHGGANINTTAYGAYTAGGTVSRVYTLSTLYTESLLFDLHYVQSADVLTVVHPNIAPYELRRLGATNWQLAQITFAPTLAQPNRPVLTVGGPGGGTPVVERYRITALAADTLEESPVSDNGLQNVVGGSAITAITKANPGVVTTAAAHDLTIGDWLYITGIEGMVELVDGVYYVASTPSAVTLTLKLTPTGPAINTTAYGVYTAGGLISRDYVKIDLTVAGNYVDIRPTAVSGAVRYNFYKYANGLWGYIGQTEGDALRDNRITADVSKTPPIPNDPFAGLGGNKPAAVGYHEQRRCFAGTNNKPQNFWATRSASENNLGYSIPGRDDDVIAFRIAARDVNQIRHIVSLDQLILLTSGGEWRVSPQNSDALTPASATPKQFAAEGASNVQPVVAASSVLYVQDSGGHVNEIKYSLDNNGLSVRDLSILPPHLFDGFTLVDLAYQKTPNRVVWAVRSDGVLLGLTYLPEHDVVAWHEHRTDGEFESVACVKEGNEHALYAVVKRTINARTVRNVERMHTRQFTDRADAFFVDSGATYSGAPADVITGLWHLEGETVSILADGATHPQRVVSGGSITLEAEFSKVQIGLPIVADIETLPLAFEMQALGQGVTKNVNEVALRLKDTTELKVGHSFTEMQDIAQRTGEPYGAPPALITGVERVPAYPEWGEDAKICIRQDTPQPATVLSMVVEVAVGG